MKRLRDLITHLEVRIAEARTAVCQLDSALADQHRALLIQDQAHALCALRVRMANDLTRLEEGEARAHTAFRHAHLTLAPVNFAVGGLMAVLRGTSEHPLLHGLRVVGASLNETNPFGTLVVLIGERGIPDDVRTLALSKLARNEETTESAACRSLASKGLLVLSPDDFEKLLDTLDRSIRDGHVSLPITQDMLKRLLRRCDR